MAARRPGRLRLRRASRWPSAFRPQRRLAPVLVTTLLCLGPLVGCRPLYLPAIPDEIPFTPQVRATSDSAINFAADGYPTVTLELRDVAGAGWLAVQWLTPKGGEAASQSVWVEPAAEQTVSFTLPADAELVTGEWRAVVSLDGRLVRQLNFTVEPAN